VKTSEEKKLKGKPSMGSNQNLTKYLKQSDESIWDATLVLKSKENLAYVTISRYVNEASYFSLINIDLLSEIMFYVDNFKIIEILFKMKLSHEGDNDTFWKLLVIKKYPKIYKRNYNYKKLYKEIVSSATKLALENGELLSNKDIVSFFIYEDIIPKLDQIEYLIIISSNNDILAFEKIIKENYTIINNKSLSAAAIGLKNLSANIDSVIIIDIVQRYPKFIKIFNLWEKLLITILPKIHLV
jgi:hypothetical protein